MKGKPFSYNVGEAMVEAFWDPAASELKEWKLEKNGAKGAKVQQYWCYVPYEWLTTGKDQEGIAISRTYEPELSVEGFDGLLLSAAIPENGILRLLVETEQGTLQAESLGAGKKELYLPLNGAHTLKCARISVGNTTGEAATGWINWLGAQNTEQMERQIALKRQFDETWEGFLVPESYEPSFCPQYGLMVTKEELEELRNRYEEHLKKGGRDVFLENIKPYLDKKPEDMIADYMRLTDDIRFCRSRDEGQYLAFGIGEKFAACGLLKKDKKMLRMAARYVMSLLMTTNWLDSFLANYPLGLWEHSGFVPAIILGDIAAVLDCAGEMFTEKAKKMIYRQMMEKGLSKVNSVVWRYDSIFRCNQLAWYSYGRMSAYAVLSREFPRLLPYMELARQDIEASAKLVVGADGSTDEGISYFLCQPQYAGAGLFWYARAKKEEFRDCLPQPILKTDGYIDALSASSDQGTFLPICDFSEPQEIRGIAIMAYAMPDSCWVNAYHRKKEEMGGLPNDLISFLLDSRIPKEDNPHQHFLRLEDSGYLSSARGEGNWMMKVFVMGNKAGVGHNHEDKGSFLLEYGGEMFLTDPGMVSYGSAQSRALKMCDYHNMLLPTGTDERPHPSNPVPFSWMPRGTGDETELHVTMDPGVMFDQYYQSWTRDIDSARPGQLTVTDRYSLKAGKGTGVCQLFNTWYCPQIRNGGIELEGKNSICRIRIPDGVSFRVIERSVRNRTLYQLLLEREGSEGEIRLEISFRCSERS